MEAEFKNIKHYPRIACIGAEALTPSHGTGMMFARHFSNYPKSKVVDVHFRSFADRYHFQKIFVPRYELNYSNWHSPELKYINNCLKGEKREPGTSLIYKNKFFGSANIDWDKYGGAPEIIYSTCFSAEDFAFLHHIYRSLPKKVPIVQHFLDLDLTNYDDMVALYQELLPAIVDVWALTKSIWYAVAQFSVWKPEMVQALQQPIDENFKKMHRKFSKNFQSVIIGNIWSGSAFYALRKIWSKSQKKLPTLAPIDWYGHPRRFKELNYMNIDMTVSKNDKIIRDADFLPSELLKTNLQKADLAIVAFSGEYVDKEHYTNYSLPSRMGDYCANGLPLVVITRKDTEPWRLVEENKMGITLDPSNINAAVDRLCEFILDTKKREECSLNAIKFAKRELDLNKYQNLLYPKLKKLSRHKISQEILTQRFTP